MTRNQGFLLISYMIILSLTSNAIILSTPLWLSEDHVAGWQADWKRISPVVCWLGWVLVSVNYDAKHRAVRAAGRLYLEGKLSLLMLLQYWRDH
jgi:hypothetical protein